MMAWHRRSA
jgi:hypothetical protein